LTLRQWRERHLLKLVVSRCEAFLGAWGPLWEPQRSRPMIEFEDARTRLLVIEAQLTGMLARELLFLRGSLLLFTGLILALGVFMAVLGDAARGFVALSLVWSVVAGLWLWGRPVEVQGYWEFRSSGAAGPPRLIDYRVVLEGLFDVWAGVHPPAIPKMRQQLEEAGAWRVLVVVDDAWSLCSSRGNPKGRLTRASSRTPEGRID